MALTYKQTLFVEAYLGEANGNASEAARIAGYRNPGQLGHRLVKKSAIRARIDQRLASAAMPANEVLARLSEQASADLADFVEIDEAGSWRVDLRKAKRRGKTWLLSRIKMTKDGPDIELKGSDFALAKLGQYHGLWDRPPAPDDDIDEILDEADRIAAELGHEAAGGPPGEGQG